MYPASAREISCFLLCIISSSIISISITVVIIIVIIIIISSSSSSTATASIVSFISSIISCVIVCKQIGCPFQEVDFEGNKPPVFPRYVYFGVEVEVRRRARAAFG